MTSLFYYWLNCKLLDRHTSESLENQLKRRFKEFSSDLSFLFINNSITLCENVNSHELFTNEHSVKDTKHQITSTEVEFLDSIKCYGIDECIRSLKTIHNLALYHTTELCLSTKDITALYGLKLLWEGLEEVKEE